MSSIGADVERLPVDSPVFGDSAAPSEEELTAIHQLIDRMPVAVFQIFNKKLNEKHLCLIVGALNQGIAKPRTEKKEM